MKMIKIAIPFVIAVIILAACNDNSKTSGVKDTAPTEQSTGDNADTQVAGISFPIQEVINDYLGIKNALAKDKGNDAAIAAKALKATLDNVDLPGLAADQAKAYQALQSDLKEHSEHIADNGDKIAHQRNHFEMLSQDIADLVKTFGNGGQILYTDFCPMANDGKGANWISELKEIKNPYMGRKMLNCGTIKDTIK